MRILPAATEKNNNATVQKHMDGWEGVSLDRFGA
jgi:hypothetical protein